MSRALSIHNLNRNLNRNRNLNLNLNLNPNRNLNRNRFGRAGPARRRATRRSRVGTPPRAWPLKHFRDPAGGK